MNFLLYKPLIYSTILPGALQAVLIISLSFVKRDKWSLGLFLLPTALAAPLLLKSSGYYIIGEQIVLCTALSFWSLLKAVQIYRKKIYPPRKMSLVPWLTKLFALNWLILLPFSLYLTSRPVSRALPFTLSGLALAALSLVYEMIRPRLTKDGAWRGLNDIFHGGTLLFIWGLFIMIIPQLMGTDWISITGPLLYTFLSVRPWAALWSGNRKDLGECVESPDSDGIIDHSSLPYSEYLPSGMYLPFDLPQESESSDHTRIFPMQNRPHSDKAEGDRGYGI